MRDVFLVVWSGGYDAPQYELRGTDVDAWALAHRWSADMREGEHTLDVLRVDLASMAVERLGSHGADAGRNPGPAKSSQFADDGNSVLRGTCSTVRFPVSGNHQQHGFMNATPQSTADEGDSIEFSVAMRVTVDPRTVMHPVGASAVERVAHALHDLFEWLANEVARNDGPIGSVSFEAEVGPFGGGEDYKEVPAQPTAPRVFTGSVPHDRWATVRLIERRAPRGGRPCGRPLSSSGPGLVASAPGRLLGDAPEDGSLPEPDRHLDFAWEEDDTGLFDGREGSGPTEVFRFSSGLWPQPRAVPAWRVAQLHFDGGRLVCTAWMYGVDPRGRRDDIEHADSDGRIPVGICPVHEL